MPHSAHLEHRITLSGESLVGRRVSARLFRDLLDILIDGSRKALRLRLQGTSTPGGAEPKWLKPATDFDLMFPTEGEAIAVVVAKPLVATLPSLFQQSSLFDDLDPRRSPLDLFEDAVEDAMGMVDDSPRYDKGLLGVVGNFSGIFGSGHVDSLSLVNGRTVTIDNAGIERAVVLASRVAEPVPAYVVGTLEGITYSDSRFKVMLPDEKTFLLGHAEPVGRGTLRKFWGKRVAIRGLLHYRPSGGIEGLEAHSFEPVDDAHEADALLAPGRLSATEALSVLRIVRQEPEPDVKLVEAFRRHGR